MQNLGNEWVRRAVQPLDRVNRGNPLETPLKRLLRTHPEHFWTACSRARASHTRPVAQSNGCEQYLLKNEVRFRAPQEYRVNPVILG